LLGYTLGPMLVCTPKLLSRLRNDQVDALVEVMLLAAAADGELSIEEVDQLQNCLLEVDELWLTQIDLERRLTEAHQRIAGSDRATRLSTAKAILSDVDTRRAALELAIRVMAADGVMRTSERELILETAEALDIDRDNAADMVKSIVK
jgi:tellurite resistance protein